MYSYEEKGNFITTCKHHSVINTLTGQDPNDRPPSKQLFGKHNKPAIEAIVHGVGANAISFPPMLTINTSSFDIWSRRNRSWGRSNRQRSLSVVASTAVLIAAYFFFPLLLPSDALISLCWLLLYRASSSPKWFNQKVTSQTLTGGSKTFAYTPPTAGRVLLNQYLLSSDESPAVQINACDDSRSNG